MDEKDTEMYFEIVRLVSCDGSRNLNGKVTNHRHGPVKLE